jgi:hypothetical protein
MKWPKENGQNITRLKIEQNECNQKPGLNSCSPERLAVPAPHMAPVELLLLQTP